MPIKDFNLNKKLLEIFPSSWSETRNSDVKMQNIEFRNLEHFKYEVSKITQKNSTQCGVQYEKALKDLIAGNSNMEESEQQSVRNLVRSKLHKRGLITEDVYENYKYDVEGTAVGFDVGKYAAGEPDCVITPSKQYIDFFYELYVSVSYPYSVSDYEVSSNVAKLLATIEELERKHIFIKIVLILPIRNLTKCDNIDFFSSIPLFSHKDVKSVKTMSSVVNERLLRKFYFALLENTYKDNLDSGYGYPVELEGCMNIGNEFDEIEFYQEVVGKVGAGDK